jgi:hypothetical protein
MIRILTMLILGASACLAAEPKPVLMVMERDPWALVIGSDSPKFVLYDNGMLIYLRDPPNFDEPFVTRRVANWASFQKELVSFDLSKASNHYELSAATDQISTIIWTPGKTVGIYGDWRKPRVSRRESNTEMKAISEREKKMWESLPSEIRQTLLRIEEQRTVKGSNWLPEKIEVMFWPYDYAPDESILWPEDWPGLYAKDTRMRKKDSFSVYLPSEKLTELRRFFRTRKEKGAVLIDGRKMADELRFPFPGEEAWMK